MTYISAFRCLGGIVMSADTQETLAGDICYVEKIATENTPTFDLVIGGAGRGELIDGFAEYAANEVRRLNPSDLDALYKVLTDALQYFYANDVRLFPGTHKGIQFLIAARSTSGKEMNLWRTAGTRIKRVPQYACIGYNSQLCVNLARRLYRGDLSANQIVLLSVYLVSIAKSSKAFVGGDTQVVFIGFNGIWPESEDYINGMEDRFRHFNKQLDRLVLASPDFSLTEFQFSRELEAFSKAAIKLRSDYKHEVASEFVRNMTNPNWKGEPYSKLPLGMRLKINGNEADATFEMMEPDIYEAMKMKAGPGLWVEAKSITSIFIDGTNHTMGKPMLEMRSISEWEICVNALGIKHTVIAKCDSSNWNIQCSGLTDFQDEFHLEAVPESGEIQYTKDGKLWGPKFIAGALVGAALRPLLNIPKPNQTSDSQKAEGQG